LIYMAANGIKVELLLEILDWADENLTTEKIKKYIVIRHRP